MYRNMVLVKKRKRPVANTRVARSSSEPDDSDGPNDLDILDAEADAPGEDDDVEPGPLYPVEGRYQSEGDRAWVNSLPEIRREEILAERAQEVMRRQQDLQLKKAFASSAASKKRKAETSELDENTNRRSTRPKTEKQNALDSYKRAREEKGAQRDRLATGAADRRDERSPGSPARSDRDADGESDVEYAELPDRKDEPPAELRDVNRCRVGRTAFATYCFYPSFEDSVRGCFARVSIGVNRETGQNQYRMAQIKDFTEGKPYQMENAARKPFTTDQYAIVAHGSDERPWPFHACSDGAFTEAEWQRYKDTLAKQNLRLPSAKQLLEKNIEINKLIDTKFNEQLLNQKFAKQRAIELKYDPVHQAKLKRKDLKTRRAEAEQNGDEEEVARLDAKLEELDNQAANGTPSVVKVKSSATSSPAKPVANLDNLAVLNRQNRSKNQQEVRLALIAERKKIMKAREEAKAAKAAQDKVKAAGEAKRRASQNQELFGEEGTPGVSRAGTPAANGEVKKKKTELPTLGVKGPVGALKKKNLDDDVIGGLDLDIDVEI